MQSKLATGYSMGTTPIRLVFHIGAGKTGTSSIQETLRRNRDALTARGVWYLGLMLEFASRQVYPWQSAAKSEAFHAMDGKAASQQLYEVLAGTIRDAQSAGAHTLVWSNESFFSRTNHTRQPLQTLIREGVDVQIVAYVRRHDAWARSAYVQWAITHKTNRGPIQSFSEWIQRWCPRFAPAVRLLMDEYPGRVMLRNVDFVRDSAGDFLDLLGIDKAVIPTVREYVTADNAEILLRALFNSGFEGQVLPSLFDQQVKRYVDFGLTADDYMGRLMPTDADLKDVRVKCDEDRNTLNKLLEESGQAPIATEELSTCRSTVNEKELVFALAQLLIRQGRRIEQLEGYIREGRAVTEASNTN